MVTRSLLLEAGGITLARFLKKTNAGDAGQLAEIVTQTLTRGLLARERTSETMIP